MAALTGIGLGARPSRSREREQGRVAPPGLFAPSALVSLDYRGNLAGHEVRHHREDPFGPDLFSTR